MLMPSTERCCLRLASDEKQAPRADVGSSLTVRAWVFALIVLAASFGSAFAQQDKKTDDLKPADPDTGESTVEEETLGLLPNPFPKVQIKGVPKFRQTFPAMP
jgi:hypothetical protein